MWELLLGWAAILEHLVQFIRMINNFGWKECIMNVTFYVFTERLQFRRITSYSHYHELLEPEKYIEIRILLKYFPKDRRNCVDKYRKTLFIHFKESAWSHDKRARSYFSPIGIINGTYTQEETKTSRFSSINSLNIFIRRASQSRSMRASELNMSRIHSECDKKYAFLWRRTAKAKKKQTNDYVKYCWSCQNKKI